MEKCEVCGEEWDVRTEGHVYCAAHYAENEDAECLYWDVVRIKNGGILGRSPASSERILEEILKRNPGHLARYRKSHGRGPQKK